MYSPTTRLLTILEVLQAQGSVSGPELAARLEVKVRSVRRYITMLRDLGIPVESEVGRYGSYYLRPGFRLPPLMFNNAEILAVILGLMAVRQLGLTATPGVESAAAKIERVLPEELRQRIRALQGALTLNIPASRSTADVHLAAFSLAAYQGNQLWLEYRGSKGDLTQRVVDVYGLVYHVGFWYAVGYCHLRQDLRVFRLDRARGVKLLNSVFEPPPAFDALSHVLHSIATLPGMWRVEVLLKTSLEDARELISPDMALLEAVPGGVMMRCHVDGLDWLAGFLIGLGCPVVIQRPPELRESLRQLAAFILDIADTPPEDVQQLPLLGEF